MKKDVTISIRLDVSDKVLVDKIIERCRQYPWFNNGSKSEIFRVALRFLYLLDDPSFHRVMSNHGCPNKFDVKMDDYK